MINIIELDEAYNKAELRKLNKIIRLIKAARDECEVDECYHDCDEAIRLLKEFIKWKYHDQ